RLGVAAVSQWEIEDPVLTGLGAKSFTRPSLSRPAVNMEAAEVTLAPSHVRLPVLIAEVLRCVVVICVHSSPRVLSRICPPNTSGVLCSHLPVVSSTIVVKPSPWP